MKIQITNISGFDQFGIEPGQSGEAELTREEADRAVARGAIETGDLPEEEAPVPAEETEVPEDTRTQEEIDAAEDEARVQDRLNAEAAAKAQAAGKGRGKG